MITRSYSWRFAYEPIRLALIVVIGCGLLLVLAVLADVMSQRMFAAIEDLLNHRIFLSAHDKSQLWLCYFSFVSTD
jgi:hypothetical protein